MVEERSQQSSGGCVSHVACYEGEVAALREQSWGADLDGGVSPKGNI